LVVLGRIEAEVAEDFAVSGGDHGAAGASSATFTGGGLAVANPAADLIPEGQGAAGTIDP
jgi:hypothetical protein